MSNNLWLFRALKTVGLVLALGISMSATAGWFGLGSTTRWKEEVLLHDGSKLVVSRATERGGAHEIGQRPAYIEESLSFILPGTHQTVHWVDPFEKDIGSSSFLPMSLDIYEGIAYLVLDPMGCLSYNKWGRPNPPYVIFKYQGNAWQRIPLDELPKEMTTPNLVHSEPDDVADKAGGYLTAEMVRKENSDYLQPQYRTILSEPIPYGGQGQGCGELIHTSDGWEGLGFFKSQHTFEACLSYCEKKAVSSKECPCARLFKGK